MTTSSSTPTSAPAPQPAPIVITVPTGTLGVGPVRRVAALLLGLCAVATSAAAQSVLVNPTTIQFTPSADHAVVLPDGQPMVAWRIFDAPREVVDGGAAGYQRIIGTSDLAWCEAVLRDGILQKAGWPYVASRRYPFLVDTSLVSGHIDRDSGTVW